MTEQPPDLQRLKEEYARREAVSVGETNFSYSLFNPANLFMLQSRQRACLDLLRPFAPLNRRDILDVGCGAGGVLQELLAAGAHPARLHGTDLLPYRLEQARDRLLPNLAAADGQHLPYADGSFDLALQFTVFSSILDPAIRSAMAREIARVVRPGGALLWYDFWWNPTNPHTRGIRLAETRALFPASRIISRRITLAPPLVRILVGKLHAWLLASFLERISLFNTHHLALVYFPQQG